MPWNEPGGGRDPWSGRGGKDGPPDLDEVFKRMQDRLSGLFGGRRGGPREPSGPGSSLTWLLVAGVALIALLIECLYVIQPAQRGVVLRFGKYATTLEPGLTFRLPRPVESVTKVDIDQIRVVQHKAAMLTKDENIVEIQLGVQYRIKDVKDYLFESRDPDNAVKKVTETSIREVVGARTMDQVLSGEGRSEIETLTGELVQAKLDDYRTGLIVSDVNMQEAKAPEEVKSAFDDAIKAREDEQRLINEAQAYSNEVIPKSRGGAARVLEEASAYKSQVIAEATGETVRFEKILAQYERAPEVTRERLYLETMEQVLGGSAKVVMNADKGSNSLVYLPLDKLLERGGSIPPLTSNVPQEVQTITGSSLERRDRQDYRAREQR